MKRKLTEETIIALAIVGHTFLLAIPAVGIGLCLGNFFHWNVFFNWLLSFILIMWAVFLLDKDTIIQDYLNAHNERIDEAEQAQLQAEADKEKANSQIWVSE
jgi:large-conductance mechanosensitive channel